MSVEDSRITKKRLGAVKSTDTRPEMRVRRLVHAMGYRFRLHRKDLPGKPDIVLPKCKTVILIHGCFWHQHEGCSMAAKPKRNKKYWNEKFKRNKTRDALRKKQLENLGWKVVTIWECETQKRDELIRKLREVLQNV